MYFVHFNKVFHNYFLHRTFKIFFWSKLVLSSSSMFSINKKNISSMFKYLLECKFAFKVKHMNFIYFNLNIFHLSFYVQQILLKMLFMNSAKVFDWKNSSNEITPFIKEKIVSKEKFYF